MFKNALRKVFANGSVRLGGGVLLLLILMSIFAPWLGTIDPTMLDPGSQNLLPGTTNVFMTLDGDEFEHFFLMGSDSLGRDIWSRTLYGGRVSITLGISVALLAVFFGTVAGLLSGYFRWVDAVMMRVMDGFMSIPAILFAISLIAMFGNALVIVVTAIAIPSIPRIARLVRSVVLSVREEPYVEAAIALDTPSSSVSFLFIFAGFPNARLPSGISIFCVTSAPAPMIQLLPITAPFKIIAPIPINALFPTVHPCTIALCPIVTSSPMVSACPAPT